MEEGTEMTFTPNIPASGQSLGSSRTQVVNNFTNYLNLVSQDHVAPNAMGQGKHNKSTYVVQGSDPTTASGEAALYALTGSAGTEVFLIRDNIAGTKTALTTSKIAAPVASSSGISWLPGGILIQWRAVAGVSNGTAITFPVPFPNNCWVIVPGGGSSSSPQPTINFDQSTITTVGFTARITGTQPINYYFIAIGN